jgi:hypothetical protein
MTRPSSKQRVTIDLGHRQAPEDVVVWNWPLRDEGLRSWLLVVAATILVALVWTIWGNPAFTALTAATFALALWRLWIPVKWEIGLTGIAMSVFGFRRRIPWMAVARFEITHEGVWLFADREASAQRGTFIGFGDKRAGVTACIEYYLSTWAAATDSTQSFS